QPRQLFIGDVRIDRHGQGMGDVAQTVKASRSRARLSAQYRNPSTPAAIGVANFLAHPGCYGRLSHRERPMISAKLEQVDDRVALVLDTEALAALDARVGDTLTLEPVSSGHVRVTVQETWMEDAHARGRAFLKRYRRTFEQLS